jgi:hypothetical protein
LYRIFVLCQGKVRGLENIIIVVSWIEPDKNGKNLKADSHVIVLGSLFIYPSILSRGNGNEDGEKS